MIAPRPPLRITIVQGAFLPVPPRLGGAVEKAWYALGREFARRGHAVTHVGRDFPGLPENELDAGVHYVRVRGYSTPASLWRLKLLDLAYSRRVRRVLPPADVLVTNTFWLPLIERRADRGRIYVHVARFPKGQLKFYPRRSILQTVSSPIENAIRDTVPDSEDRISVVPYPLSSTYLVSPETSPEREILYAGRVHPEKGVHLLVKAFLKLRAAGFTEWKLRIVGPWATREGGGGEAYHRELQQLAAPAGDSVIFTGPVFDEQQLVSYYRRAAVFAYPSLAERGETFGLAVLEAMAAGCAPVISSLPCFMDFVRPAENGIVFDHRDSEPADRLADALAALLRDDCTRDQLRQAAWETARLYALEDVADRFLADFFALRGSGVLPANHLVGAT